MNDNEVKTVQMTAEEAAQYAAFKAEQERKAAADKARKDREVYGQMVDEEIEQAIPMLRELSGDIRTVKEQVLDNFRQILDMKADVLKRTKDGQKSHTFTNSTGDKRITIGRCVVDGWRDTVEDGIAIVKEAVMGLIKDDETKAMINQIMRLIARDQNGNLKASKVLQLDTLPRSCTTNGSTRVSPSSRNPISRTCRKPISARNGKTTTASGGTSRWA